MTAIMHLAPHTQSGFNVCAYASKGCSKACLYFQGRGRMDNVQNARLRKTKAFFKNRVDFMQWLSKDIEAVVRKAERENMTPCIRLNGTSDIPWERVPFEGHANIMEAYPDVQFYDYTKRPDRQQLGNYHLTFSLAEDNDERAKKMLKKGINVAVVFKEVPKSFWGYPVYDGDDTDLRFTDPEGHIIGLKAKGSAKNDTTGFVR